MAGRAGAGRRATYGEDDATDFSACGLGGRGGSCGLHFFSDKFILVGARLYLENRWYLELHWRQDPHLQDSFSERVNVALLI